MFKRTTLVILAALLSTLAARGDTPVFDPEFRSRRLERDQHIKERIAEFNKIQAATKALVERSDEVATLAKAEETLRADITRAESALAVMREELIGVAVRHCLAQAKLETMMAKEKSKP